MVEVQLYRAKIRELGSNSRLGEDSMFLFTRLLSIMVLFYLLVLVMVVNLKTFNDFKIKTLKHQGDVELNPVPYEIIRSVQDRFS